MKLTEEKVEELLAPTLNKMRFDWNIEIEDGQITIHHNCSIYILDQAASHLEEIEEERGHDLEDYEKQEEFEKQFCKDDVEAMDELNELGFYSEADDTEYFFDFAYDHTISVKNFKAAFKELQRKEKIEKLLKI